MPNRTPSVGPSSPSGEAVSSSRSLPCRRAAVDCRPTRARRSPAAVVGPPDDAAVARPDRGDRPVEGGGRQLAVELDFEHLGHRLTVPAGR